MVNYWKEKVLPKIKKVFEKNGAKKAAAAEATKTFDEAKEQYAKEFEDKKTELQPKVVEIYEATSTEVKGLIKAPKETGLKKHAVGVQKFLDELVKIEFPGSKAVSEASSNFGPGYVSGPVSFVFEKVSTFIVVEEKKEDEAPAAAAAAKGETTTATAAEETSTEVKEKDIVVEGEKKEEAPAAPEAVASAEKTEAPAAEAPAPAATEAPKVEEAAAGGGEPPKA